MLNPDQGRYNLAEYMDVFQDKGGRLTVEDVSRPEFENRFSPLELENPALTEPETAYWMRFRMHGNNGPNEKNGETPVEMLLQVGENFSIIIDKVDLYLPALPDETEPGRKVFTVQKSGALRPPDEGEIKSRNYMFKIPARVLDGSYLYLRLESQWKVWTPITLWSGPAYQLQTSSYNFAFGIIYGVIGCMILYNIFIYISLRVNTYLFYILYMASSFIWQFQVHGLNGMLLGRNPGLDLVLMWVFMGFTLFWALIFSRSFLMTQTNSPRFDKVLFIISALGLAVVISALAGKLKAAFDISHLAGLITPPIIIAAGIRCLFKGFRPARYFLTAWIVLLLSGLSFALMGLRILPVNFLTVYGFVIGIALESVLLSFALADRIKTIRREKENSRASSRRYIEMSITDGLTGLYNARFFKSKLREEVAHAHRVKRPLSIIILDIDDFKIYNDTYGHLKGDSVLTGLADVVRTSIRESDSACRQGGEEFAAILQNTDAGQAFFIAERIRIGFASQPFRPAPGRKVFVSVSLGLAQLSPDDSEETLQEKADQALYQAKRRGKNMTFASKREIAKNGNLLPVNYPAG